MMRDPKVQKIITKIKQLPTLPQVITRLIQIIDRPDSSASEVSKIISTDQSLMTKVLKLVNSPFYGMPKRITTLSQATVILGFNAIKNLALTAAIFDQFGGKGEGIHQNGFSREKFWEHSIAVAVASKIISEHIGYPQPEEAFMAGLIHDIGKVVLDQFLHDEFVEALKYSADNQVSISDAEIKIIGSNHAQIGG
ncbi:MAG: HDOD domain-containing protein, partial [Calditrichaeota bacterium]